MRTCAPGGGGGRVHTRFPPEPNGYLHVGHAKSICLNFGLAEEYGGKFNLRFDDTNPLKEEMEFVEGIKRDVLWLGADWTGPNGGGIFWASDYFRQMYDYAVELVKKGRAYVCDLTAEQTREMRGTLTEPGGPARSATARSARIWTCSTGCAAASSPTARARCGRRSTWPRRT